MKKAKKLPKVLEESEVQGILNAFNLRYPTGLRNRVVVEAMFRAGLRVSEVCALHLGHIKMERRIIEVHEGKGKKDRNVPFDGELAFWLLKWTENRPECVKSDKHIPFFCQITKGREGMPLCQQYLDTVVKRMAVRAGVEREKVSCHTFRHSYATMLINNGFNIREIQCLLGHSDVSTTMLYTHVNPKTLSDKINMLGNKDTVQTERNLHIQELRMFVENAQNALRGWHENAG